MRRYAVVTAAAISLGGIALLPTAFAQQTAEQPAGQTADQAGDRMDRAADRTGDAMRRAGDAVTGNGTVAAPDAEGIRDVLAQIAEASVTKDGLDDLVERFVDADRNRLGAETNLDEGNDHLNGIIEQFRKNWQAKYNQEFDIKDEDAVFNASFASITQGEIGDGARVAGERQPGAAPDADRIGGGDTNRDPGRNIATVVIAESHGMPPVTLSLIHELPDSWRLDLPDTVSAAQVRKNLEDCLTKLNEKQAEWPADVNDGYRKVTHKIAMAVIDQKAEGMDKGGMQDRPAGDQGQAPDQPR